MRWNASRKCPTETRIRLRTCGSLGRTALALTLTAVFLSVPAYSDDHFFKLGGSQSSPDLDPRILPLTFEEEDESDEDEDQPALTPFIEEFFLGTIIYPQEANEVQLTFGHFNGIETLGNRQTFFEIEYGITDRLQIGMEVPFETDKEDSFEGVREIGVELYYNFYADPIARRGYGVGFEWGIPIDSTEVDSRAQVYEPFFVAYQEFDRIAVNISAALEVVNPLDSGEETETAGDIVVGILYKAERLFPLLEVQVGVESNETPVLLAPGLYYRRFLGPIDGSISLPIGLTDDAPDFAVFLMAVVEFEASKLKPNLFW